MDTLKFTMPAENISFFVEIEKVVYSITYVVDGNGSIEEPKTDSAEYDDSVMINAIPDSGYKVGSYSCIGQSSGEAIAFDESPIGIAFLMPAEDVIFYITFVEEE